MPDNAPYGDGPRYVVGDRYDGAWGGQKFFVVDMQRRDYATDQMWLTRAAAQQEADRLNAGTD